MKKVVSKLNQWIWIGMGVFITLQVIANPIIDEISVNLQKKTNSPPYLSVNQTIIAQEPDELLIEFKDTTSQFTKNQLAQQLQTTLRDTISLQMEHWHLQDTIVTLNNTTVIGIENITTYVENNYSYVEFAEPNYIYNCHGFVPNDPSYNLQYGLHQPQIDATTTWGVQQSSPSIILSVLDTGFDDQHQDLINNVYININEIPNDGIDNDNNGYIDDYKGWDFINNDNNPSDDNGHGTHVAGIIAAEGNNGIGVTGVTYSAQLMNLKVFDANGSTNTLAILKAIDYSIAQGAHILNNSWGGRYSKAIFRAIQRTQAAGQLFVAAAGNWGLDNDINSFYPASYNLDS